MLPQYHAVRKRPVNLNDFCIAKGTAAKRVQFILGPPRMYFAREKKKNGQTLSLNCSLFFTCCKVNLLVTARKTTREKEIGK